MVVSPRNPSTRDPGFSMATRPSPGFEPKPPEMAKSVVLPRFYTFSGG